jgi:hypothetical protein
MFPDFDGNVSFRAIRGNTFTRNAASCLALYLQDRIHWPVDRTAVGDGTLVRWANDGAVLFEQTAQARRRLD